MRLNLRHLVTIGVCAIAFACEPGVPAFAPIDTSPGVEASQVRDHLDIFTETDPSRFLALASKAVGPEGVSDEAQGFIRRRVEPGSLGFTRMRTADKDTLFFAAHTVQGYSGIVLDRSSTSKPIAPVDWIRAAVLIRGGDPAAVRAWCIAMSERLANGASASGIIVYANGNSMAVVLDMRYSDDDGDELLAVRTKFFKKGETDVSTWGPRLDNPTSVGTRKMNGHDGVSIRDLLKWKLIAPHGQASPFPEDLPGPIPTASEPPPDPNASPFPVAPSSQPTDAGASINL